MDGIKSNESFARTGYAGNETDSLVTRIFGIPHDLNQRLRCLDEVFSGRGGVANFEDLILGIEPDCCIDDRGNWVEDTVIPGFSINLWQIRMAFVASDAD